MSHHVLVVDDDPGIRAMLQAVLEAEQYNVATARNGREALECIAEEPPTLVLLDLNMPIVSGWDVFHYLRAARATCPIVFMTAGQHARAEAERHQADGYLGKPFTLQDLLDVIHRLGIADSRNARPSPGSAEQRHGP